MKNYLIYVVEDNKIYNHLVTEFLKKNGFEKVKSWYSGQECIQSLKKEALPDIVIQDYHMQDMTGIDVLRKVKKISPKSDFIFLTGNESTEVAVNSIKYGAFDYIIKDEVALDKVNDKIKKIIKRKELENKNSQIRKYMWIFLAVIFLLILFSVLHFVYDFFELKNLMP